MQSIPRLETERLLLRALRPGDTEGVFELFSDPQVVAFYEFEPITEREQAVEWLQKFTLWFQHNQAVRWGLFRKSDHAMVGSGCLDTFNFKYRSANLGYNLRSDSWGQGLATEAARAILQTAFDGTLGPAFNRIQALTVPENVASTRVLSRLGFQPEGRMREYGYWKGRFHDLQMHGLLKADWEATSTVKP